MTGTATFGELDTNGLEVLSGECCMQRLARGGIGRIGLMADGTPSILPVNFILVGSQIWILTGSGTILEAARGEEPVAFEVDEVDPFSHGGLSVLARGRARVIEMSTLAAASPLRAWGNARANRLVAITIDQLTGRQIGRASRPSARTH